MEGTNNRDNTISEGEQILLSLIGSLGNGPSYALEFLSCRDRLQLQMVSKSVASHVRRIEYHRCKDGRLYKVPFPGYIGLLDSQPGDGLFPHQLASLHAIHNAENRCTEFGALRGGILGDAPGLGKSITMLAVIAATAGRRPKVPPDNYDEDEVQEGWKYLSQNPSRTTDIIRCLKCFRAIPGYRTLLDYVKPPFELERLPSLMHFQRHVNKWARKNGAYDVEIEEFRKNVMTLRSSLVKSNRKVLMSELGRRQAWERSLVPACSTLVIVPDALCEHWASQCLEHLNLPMFADSMAVDGRGVVFLDGFGDLVDASLPLGHVNKKRHLPSSWELARYTIVVTTFSRCKDEYRRAMIFNSETTLQGRKRGHSQLQGGDTESPFLKVRWLRVVVDEGHELGSHEGGSEVTKFVHELAAERRWVMSGTPVVGNLDDSSFSANALDQIQRLLVYLRHPVYGNVPAPVQNPSMYMEYDHPNNSQNGKDEEAKRAWNTSIKRPFLAKDFAGRNELLRVLREICVLHTKDDIHLPKPIFEFPEIDIPVPQDVQRRIKQSGGNFEELLRAYLYSQDFQEIVDKTQGNYIFESVREARAALNERGGPLQSSETMMMLTQEELELRAKRDRRAIKAVVYSSNKNNLRDVTEALYSNLNFENIAEAYDDPRSHPETELSRFRHNAKQVRNCPVCGRDNGYQGSVADKRHGKCENFLMEVVKRDDEQIRFLVEPERVVRAIPMNLGGNVDFGRLGGLDYSRYGDYNRLWREDDILEVNIVDPHPVLKKRESYGQWQDYGMDKCIELATSESFLGRDWFFGPLPSIEKEGENRSRTIEVVLKKWQKCSTFHGPRWYTGPKLVNSPVRTLKEDCFILSLDAGLSHGLDLSFVTHIFLLEPVDDAALLEQITSRAHRLGATGPVTVTTVNTYYSLDDKSKFVNNDKKRSSTHRSLTKVVCSYCYREFGSMDEAVKHEDTKCTRNPRNATARDPWHIASIYRELRPPPPYDEVSI